MRVTRPHNTSKTSVGTTRLRASLADSRLQKARSIYETAPLHLARVGLFPNQNGAPRTDNLPRTDEFQRHVSTRGSRTTIDDRDWRHTFARNPGGRTSYRFPQAQPRSADLARVFHYFHLALTQAWALGEWSFQSEEIAMGGGTDELLLRTEAVLNNARTILSLHGRSSLIPFMLATRLREASVWCVDLDPSGFYSSPSIWTELGFREPQNLDRLAIDSAAAGIATALSRVVEPGFDILLIDEEEIFQEGAVTRGIFHTIERLRPQALYWLLRNTDPVIGGLLANLEGELHPYFREVYCLQHWVLPPSHMPHSFTQIQVGRWYYSGLLAFKESR